MKSKYIHVEITIGLHCILHLVWRIWDLFRCEVGNSSCEIKCCIWERYCCRHMIKHKSMKWSNSLWMKTIIYNSPYLFKMISSCNVTCSLNVSTNFQHQWRCLLDSKSDILSNISKSLQLIIECEPNCNVQEHKMHEQWYKTRENW